MSDVQEPPSPALKADLSSEMIDSVRELWDRGLGKVAKIDVRIDFKDGQMIGFERKAK